MDNNLQKKSYTCEVETCLKSFSSSWALCRHRRIHTGEKPFHCTFPKCAKSFTEKSAMTRHLVSHSSEKPYSCSYAGCNKSFKGKEYLEFHVKLHTERDPFCCRHPGCTKVFKSPKSLKKHVRMWHTPNGIPISIEQQLRERIINMASRNKEKQRIADETICALRNENAKLLVRIVEMEKVLAPPC